MKRSPSWARLRAMRLWLTTLGATFVFWFLLVEPEGAWAFGVLLGGIACVFLLVFLAIIELTAMLLERRKTRGPS